MRASAALKKFGQVRRLSRVAIPSFVSFELRLI
jgi:hypothetical protein